MFLNFTVYIIPILSALSSIFHYILSHLIMPSWEALSYTACAGSDSLTPSA